MTLDLEPVAGLFAVCRLGAGEPPPAWLGGPFSSVTVTPSETSVVCEEARVPASVRAERGWRLLRVGGRLDFALVGVLASLAAPLAEAGVSLFAVSTFDTDYLLVKGDDLAAATAALEGAGHRVRPPVEAARP